MIIPVIMAGGTGTRMWPASRKALPKQFAPLLGGDTLFQQTVKRLSDPRFDRPCVISAEECRFIARDQMGAAGASNVLHLVEPVARNTAAAVLTAALAHRDQPEEVLLISHSDHVISDEAGFHAAVDLGRDAAAEGEVVCFGVFPTHPSSAYGYLQVDRGSDAKVQKVNEFIEKPDAAAATELLGRGNSLWNAGIFMLRVDVALELFKTHAPDLLPPCHGGLSLGGEDLGFHRLNRDAFKRCRAIAFDRAIMEKLPSCTVVSLDCGWADLGSWSALRDHQVKKPGGNALIGDASAIDCRNSLLKSTNSEMAIVGLGLDGIVAVATDDAVLVADASRSEEVGKAIEVLNARSAPQAEEFPRCHRPWGFYETLSLGARFQVKRIVVHPGQKLSLQSHVHRAEHWVVVEGSALVTVGEETKLVGENESTYIPLGAVHRLENPGKLPLALIEVQSGCYLGEDDITRYEDIYARDQNEEVA
ncbi:MAG: mannose-1-phosphate guanylyltransferase/mannose-6-phosphate isomerase [Pseudomonadota bacterium]|nr:mannose-1-phosphate guanylyltransferase/mannose-6-phosphate isomerase [Pseudomonadota bacterium]